MSSASELQDVERVVQNAANSLGVKLHIVKSHVEDPTGVFVIGIARQDKTLLLRIPQRCFQELRDNCNHHRMTELKAKIKKLLTPTN